MVKNNSTGENSITFLDKLNESGVKNVLDKVCAVFLPSIVHENAPNIIGEAHAKGVRVFASRTGGMPELLKESDVLIEPGSIEDIFFALDNFVRKNFKV